VSPPLHRRLRTERANRRVLETVLDDFRPDVVSVWNMGAMSLGLLRVVRDRGIPLVYAVCSDWLYYGPLLDAWSRLFTRRPTLGRVVERVAGVPAVLPDIGRSGTFLFVSGRTREHAEAKTPWRFPDSTIVYSGIDPVDFPLGAVDAVERPWQWRLLYVGRLDPRKGIDDLVRALASLPSEATLEVIGSGDGHERDRLRSLARDLGVDARVTFDAVPRDTLAARYRAADVCVFPSTWDEPFGLVPVEAMASGIPVVATGTGGSAEFLADGVNCLLYEPGNPAALADAVRRVAGDATLRHRLVHGGRETASGLTVETLADVMEAWHVGAADRFAGGRPADRPAPAAMTMP
jgi:glycosyltransferase involved in cell wall biosynthesis